MTENPNEKNWATRKLFKVLSLKFCKVVVVWQKTKPIRINNLLSKPKHPISNFMIHSKAIHCNVKENLNPLLDIPAPQNAINEIDLVYLVY